MSRPQIVILKKPQFRIRNTGSTNSTKSLHAATGNQFERVRRHILSERVRRIINQNYGREHNFLVTRDQVDELIKSGFEKREPLEWLKIVTGVDQFTENVFNRVKKAYVCKEVPIQRLLYPDNLRNREPVYQDHTVRAKKIVDHMITHGKKNLVTMDGHGRFVMCFLRELIRRRQKVHEYTITLFDIDDTTNRWHEHFLPTNVVVASGNILEATFDGSECVYLNFCSIGKNSEKLGEFIELFTEFQRNFFLSFTTRGCTGNDDTSVSRVVAIIEEKGTLVSSRGSFKTFSL